MIPFNPWQFQVEIPTLDVALAVCSTRGANICSNNLCV